MKKFLVPTDFSETAKNAARFAVQMANDIGNTSVVLYNAYDAISTGADGTTVFSNNDARHAITLAALNNMKIELQELAASVEITVQCKEGDLIENLTKLFHHQQIDLVIMGINGATKLEEILIGSTTLSLINHNICPVLIIPPDAAYRSIKTVVFASDFKDVEETTPTVNLRKFLSMVNPVLHVVNVDVDHYVELTEDYKQEKVKLTSILDGFNPEYSFIRMYDFVESINMFANDRKADLIITVPKRHSFLEGLFRSSHTKKLAYHTHIPILALHE